VSGHQRPARLHPDSLPVLVFAVAVTALLALVSFALSFAGLVAVAEWAGVPPWLRWAVPVVVDGAQLVFTAGMLVHAARGDSTARSWAALGLFAAVSIAANAAHGWDADAEGWRAYAGAFMAGLAPLAVVLSIHELAALAVARPTPVDVAGGDALDHERETDRRMRDMRDAGASLRSIASACGVSRSTVARRLSQGGDTAKTAA
jgi:hypothetical protein